MREILLVEDLESDAELLKRTLKSLKVANRISHLARALGSWGESFVRRIEKLKGSAGDLLAWPWLNGRPTGQQRVGIAANGQDRP